MWHIPMTAYLIERQLPGASQLTEEDLQDLVDRSRAAAARASRPCTWRHSYIAGDKLYCVYEADSVDVVLEHARRSGFAAHLVSAVSAVVDGHGRRTLPA